MSVTFIIPFRNCVKDLSEVSWRYCIEHMQKQTFTDWTAIFIDDRSKDNSPDILLSYNEPRIKLVRNETHIGLTKSLNRALTMVKTPYVARHDSDDFSHPERLNRQIEFLKSQKDISVVGSFAKVYNSRMESYDTQDKPVQHDDIKRAAIRTNPMLHGSILMRTNVLKDCGGYDESFYVCQDYALWSKLLIQGFRFHNIPQYLYNRISHGKCASKMNRHLRKTAILRIRAMHKR